MSKLKVDPITTPPFILSYPWLIEPKQFKPKPGEAPQKPKWGCTAIFDAKTVESDPKYAKLREGAKEAKANYFGSNPPRGLKNPFRKNEDQWQEVDGVLRPEPGYGAGGIHIMLDAGDRVKPDCRDEYMRPVVDASVLYAGCKCVAVVRPSGYNYQELNKGVKFYLMTLQKIGDGPNIAGRVNADDYFKPVKKLEDNATTGATTGDGWEDDEDPEDF